MWTSVLMVIATAGACGGAAESSPDPADSAHACCITNALRQAPSQAAVTFFCRDGSSVTGEVLEYDTSQHVIRLLPKGATRPGRSSARLDPADARSVPRQLAAADVTRLEWRERRHSPVAAAIVGLLIGALIGGGVGSTAAPSSQGFLDFTGLVYGLGGAAIGGGLGLTLGIVWALGSRDSRAIDCPDGSMGVRQR